jgi:CRAL/TRIO domain
MKLCLDQSHKTGSIIETVTVIIDIKDMRLGQVTRDFLHILRLIGQMDASQYPEILGKAFIINAPSAFPMVWKLIKMWLDPIVAQKISILGGPNDWRPKVFDFIGEENMPSTYGGKLPLLSNDMHPYAGYMAQYSNNPDVEYWNTKAWHLPSKV